MMGSMIATLTLLLVFSAALSNAQLNFEGNPLTENTDYTAEESQSLEKTAVKKLQKATKDDEISQKIYPVYTKNIKNDKSVVNESSSSIQKSIELTPTINNLNLEARNLQYDPYNVEQIKKKIFIQQPRLIQEPITNYALNSFLNSKTPEESRLALDYYINSQPTSRGIHKDVNPIQRVKQIDQVSNDILLQQNLPQQYQNIQFQQNPSLQIQHHQQQQQQQQQFQIPPQTVQIQPIKSNLQIPTPNFHVQPQQNYPFQPQPNFQDNSLLPQNMNLIQSSPQMQVYSQDQMPMASVYQPRVPYNYGPAMTRFSRHQGRPIGRFQSKPIMPSQQRIGPSVVYKGPPPVIPASPPIYPSPNKFKNSPPVEVIYTKPPGFGRRPPHINSPSVPYEDATAWFPEADHPPASKDIYYSQLYAQSYDPHYYNYIAKTGKIKPHLYGKFHEHPPEDEGIWSEMLKGFKKHGLKNIMNPTFLLGMTIPALTLMLTALVQKRSFARADFGPPTMDQDRINEYMTRLQKALQIYDEHSKNTVKKNGNNRRR